LPKPIRLGQGGDLETCAELRERAVVVLVGVIRAELVAEFVQDEAVRFLGHAIEPVPAKNADVEVEERKAQKVSGTVASPPCAALVAWPMDKPDAQRSGPNRRPRRRQAIGPKQPGDPCVLLSTRGQGLLRFVAVRAFRPGLSFGAGGWLAR
jgi:hypothetical protein